MAHRRMARRAYRVISTMAPMMKTPETAADTRVTVGDTRVRPAMISPTSVARLPMYTYASTPVHSSRDPACSLRLALQDCRVCKTTEASSAPGSKRAYRLSDRFSCLLRRGERCSTGHLCSGQTRKLSHKAGQGRS